MELSDEALIERFQATKDSSYLKSFLSRYQGRIYNAAYHILGNPEEAEEVVQETCIKVLINLPRYRAGSSPAAWVFRMASNLARDMLRFRQRRKLLHWFSFQALSTYDKDCLEPGAPVCQVADGAPPPEEELMMKEQAEELEACLQKLPESQRVVVVLRDIEGLSYEEIAAIVGASSGTVRSRLHYGRLKLRQLIEPYLGPASVSISRG